MPETTTPATELASQYIAQVTGDLDANIKEQERVSAEIASLQEQLASLQRDHGVLVSMHQALGITTTPTESSSESAHAVVPSPRRKKDDAADGGKQKARKASTATPRKRTAGKSAAKTASTAKSAGATKSAGTAKSAVTTKTTDGVESAGTTESAGSSRTAGPTKTAGSPKTASSSKTAGRSKSTEPTLVELIRRHLSAQKEPRSAAEISTALGQAHPHRDIAAKVVRVTLEGLVAKSQAERSKQGRSVFYTAPATQSAAAPEAAAQTEDSDS
ncbi:hypothetical protein OR263_24195 [Streptomyces sp. NEAU-H22]|uniref:hypothetical protein n=1 Tax=unclassified Streptomyces TaxID=2593676 RepID=UPI002251AB36|nr:MULTISPECIES: hypothetical protein [unclassified Streptomyces]MCX3289771.1 hypothetical protein [Streptomyces sp. NEAU-H22]WMD06455.1 hypothetical protein Q7C01_19595 [Streptomyces sp. FXY-T5]